MARKKTKKPSWWRRAQRREKRVVRRAAPKRKKPVRRVAPKRRTVKRRAPKIVKRKVTPRKVGTRNPSGKPVFDYLGKTAFMYQDGVEIPYRLVRDDYAGKYGYRLSFDGHSGRAKMVVHPATTPDSIRAYAVKHAKWLRRIWEKAETRKKATVLPGRLSQVPQVKVQALLKKIHTRMAHFNKHYSFQHDGISINESKKAWGLHYGRDHSMKFHIALSGLPSHLLDYVVVHELCHTGELNHSPRFWALVARADPNWQAHRRELNAGYTVRTC